MHQVTTTSQTPAKNIDVAVQHGPNPDEIYVCQVIDMESVAPERRKSMRKEIVALQSIVHRITNKCVSAYSFMKNVSPPQHERHNGNIHGSITDTIHGRRSDFFVHGARQQISFLVDLLVSNYNRI